MVVDASTSELSLDETVSAVQQMLEDAGIHGRSLDGRVAPLPDARTIRYYTTLGLVDRPRIVDREARYGQRHVLQLAAIKRLQAEGARLADIQARLYGQSDAELHALFATTSRAARSVVSPGPVVWREVAIAPGLKILAQAGWTADADTDELMKRVRAALDVLSAQRRHQKG
jgi:DNA-binding transcriptional MerR regulator